jgi:hypothetical protein
MQGGLLGSIKRWGLIDKIKKDAEEARVNKLAAKEMK